MEATETTKTTETTACPFGSAGCALLGCLTRDHENDRQEKVDVAIALAKLAQSLGIVEPDSLDTLPLIETVKKATQVLKRQIIDQAQQVAHLHHLRGRAASNYDVTSKQLAEANATLEGCRKALADAAYTNLSLGGQLAGIAANLRTLLADTGIQSDSNDPIALTALLSKRMDVMRNDRNQLRDALRSMVGHESDLKVKMQQAFAAIGQSAEENSLDKLTSRLIETLLGTGKDRDETRKVYLHYVGQCRDLEAELKQAKEELLAVKGRNYDLVTLNAHQAENIRTLQAEVNRS